jgi:hypothetical protein
MDTLQKNIAKYNYDKENRKEFYGSIVVGIMLAVFTIMYFSIL